MGNAAGEEISDSDVEEVSDRIKLFKCPAVLAVDFPANGRPSDSQGFCELFPGCSIAKHKLVHFCTDGFVCGHGRTCDCHAASVTNVPKRNK